MRPRDESIVCRQINDRFSAVELLPLALKKLLEFSLV